MAPAPRRRPADVTAPRGAVLRPGVVRPALTALLALVLLATLVAPAQARTDFRLDGRGNGHGIGLSQYGAQGQALDGRSHEQILRTYYQGTSLTKKAPAYPARIGVAGDQAKVKVVVENGPARVTFPDGASAFDAAAGSTWIMSPNSVGGCQTAGPGNQDRASGPCPVFDPADGARIRVHHYVEATGRYSLHFSYGRSALVEVVSDAVNGRRLLDVVVEIPLEQYLYGLAEMPYSWEYPALKAQAIAGRSYALHRMLATGANPDRGCSCHLYDSQQDQVYKGTVREDSPMWDRWKAVVDATADVVVNAPGQVGTVQGVVQAFYSSSSNGRTEAKHELWGGEPFPYLVSVKDPWAYSDAVNNPHRWWTAGVTPAVLARSLGIDDVDRVRVTSRSTSGAATAVEFEGQDGGRDVTLSRTGSWVRTALGLRSTTIDKIFLPPFVDDDGSIHELDIVWLAEQGITAGCNPPTNDRFCPESVVTRGQMAAFLTRALGLRAGTKDFDDSRGHLFEEEISALERAGITYGCNPPANTRFCPDAPVTREQMASFLQRALRLPAGPARFEDVSGSVHRDAIYALAKAGITVGCNPPQNTRFCPSASVTRQQMASFLRRADV